MNPLSIDRPRLAHLASVRVAGVLVVDALIYPTTGTPPHAVLMLHLQAKTGLPYEARIDLGDDITQHMLAEAELPRMRAGAFMLLSGDALVLRADHGKAALRVVNARDAVVFSDPIQPQPQEA